ncbi:integrase arm-type DNA-binding domain-containing protein [Novosphingobium sp. G106]|uniref:tyrosine-type recombinase/integrase n=1 Tax=Novosphingobium sp. G106 TaxID=2849500 RepID=UPI001C2D3DAF|nr:integrase arm-type DNA-binding domain-containing protein [Novosphingobium sp. G106]MBV1689028.1 integrase arm-type DNA-binding domain-containing protein [Novosphingobium sp. G106]
MLNDAKLRAAKPRDKEYKLTDSYRLYLLVKPGGGKLWRWNYAYGGKQKSMNFGIYPMVSLLEARAKRDEARALLGEGKDPAIVKRLRIQANRDAAAMTFERVAREWHQTLKSQWAAIHADDVIRSLERDVFPAIGALPISELTPPLVLQALRSVEARGSIETAKRIRQRISAVFEYAVAQGTATSDPAEKLGSALKPPRKGRQPAITDITRLQKMIREADEDYARPITRLALRLLSLTAVRPGELRGARWDEFEDLDGPQPLWRIPALRMKGDCERKAEADGDHLVPLARQSVDVLRALWPITGTYDLLFPSTRHAHKPMSENAIGYLLNRAGYHGHHVPHGFRAAFSTIMNEWANAKGKTDDRAIIDLMLAHVPKGKVEGAYNRAAYMPRRRQLAQIWADMLTPPLAAPVELAENPARQTGAHSRRRMPNPVSDDFRFPSRARVA